jgi:threonyl-tRNA synthetase
MIDHRKLGRELDLFRSDPLAGAGLPIWLPDGAAARHAVEEYIREEERRAGYQHVYSPPLGKRQLFELSGHLPHFEDDMFPPMRLSEDDELVLRPAMCPYHALVFRSRGRSYRDLPLRIAELGGMYRAERSGVLGGLSRVRSIWLNDAHNFCAIDQAGDEVAAILRMIQRAHAALGVRPAGFRLSLRGEGGKYVDNPPMWDRASAVLRSALDGLELSYVDAPGEAAFYGPKIDVQVLDAAGREMSLSTVQLDFHQPAQFGLSYVDRDGERRRPVIVHRSIVGSMERLFAYLIEVHEGAFPLWYAPVQVEVLPVGDVSVDAFAREAIAAGLRVRVNAEGSLGSRIREAASRRVPYAAVIGARDPDRVSLRPRCAEPLPPIPFREAIAEIAAAAKPA